jgi:HEAT repeat protein
MGARAVPALIAALADPEHGWQAASILADIGAPAALPAVPALRKLLARGVPQPRELWAARALGRLGQLDTLVALAKSPRTQLAAVVGLSRARPQSYPHFEALLARGDRTLAAMIAEELKPGSASYEAPPAGFDLLVAAAASKHAALRKDAAIALWSFRRGEDKARAVPVLARMLRDRVAEVRRLAVWGLAGCRGHARGVLDQITPLTRDPVAAVRDGANHAIAEIRKRRP